MSKKGCSHYWVYIGGGLSVCEKCGAYHGGKPHLLRPYVCEDGATIYETVAVCLCDDRRGPLGGVCGNCGGAIPSPTESMDMARKELRK